jgi:hypothetical protein
MRVKSAQAGEGGGCTPSHSNYISTITYKVVFAPAERANTLPIFLFYPYICVKKNMLFN